MQIVARRIFFLIVVFAAIPAMAGKVGFLDTERAIKTVKEGQRQMQVLDVWANQRADEVEKMRDQVTETTERLNAQRTIATEDVLRELENELLQAQRELEDAARALRSDFDAKQMELLSEVATRVREIADEYARANGFDAIFMLESQPLLYVAESAIITDAVVRLYDQRYPAD